MNAQGVDKAEELGLDFTSHLQQPKAEHNTRVKHWPSRQRPSCNKRLRALEDGPSEVSPESASLHPERQLRQVCRERTPRKGLPSSLG